MESKRIFERNYIPILVTVLIFLLFSTVGVLSFWKQNAVKVAEISTKTKTYSSEKYHLSFSYPSNWGSVTEEDGYIYANISDSDPTAGGLQIEINNNFSGPASICKYCFEYKATVKNGSVTLKETKSYTQNQIRYNPVPITAKGREYTTDKFQYLNNSYKLTLSDLDQKNDSAAASKTEKLVFEEIAASIKID